MDDRHSTTLSPSTQVPPQHPTLRPEILCAHDTTTHDAFVVAPTQEHQPPKPNNTMCCYMAKPVPAHGGLGDVAPHAGAEIAVAQLAAAGDSIPDLVAAIRASHFLEKVPGAPRQALRAAKRKLKTQMAAHRAAEEAAAARAKAAGALDPARASAIAEDAARFARLVSEYENLKWRMVKMPGGAIRRTEDYYRLHGLMMQATQGDLPTESECPTWSDKGNIDFHGRSVWEAWQKLRGMPPVEARSRFVSEFFAFPPEAVYKDERPKLIAAMVAPAA